MNNALYKNPNGTTQILKAIEISREDYQSIYKGHLFCTTSGCNAQLIYMPVEKKNIAYFKTLQGDDHSLDCPNNFDRHHTHPGFTYTYTTGDEGIPFNESHVKSVMKDTFNILKNGKKTLKAPTNRRKHRTSPKTDSTNTTPQIYNVSNTTTQKAQHRNPPIYKKNVSEFIQSQMGTYAVYGYLNDIEIGQDYAYLTITDNKSMLKLYAGNIFISNSRTEFNLLPTLNQYLNLKQHPELLLVAICHKTMQNQNDEAIGELISHDKLTINNMEIKNFISYINNK